MIFSLGRG